MATGYKSTLMPQLWRLKSLSNNSTPAEEWNDFVHLMTSFQKSGKHDSINQHFQYCCTELVEGIVFLVKYVKFNTLQNMK